MHLQDFVTPEMVANLVLALAAIVTALAAYVANAAKLYLQSKLTTSQWDFMRAQAATAVKYLKQSPAWSAEEGAKKKQFAIAYLMQIAERAKIPMTAEMLDKIIEAEYHDIKEYGIDLLDLDEGETGPVLLPETVG